MRNIAGLPFLLQEGMDVAFVPPQLDAPRKGKVEEVHPIKGDVNLVMFDSVQSIDSAEALAGCYCLARRCDLPEDYETSAEAFCIGFQVEDVMWGRLGEVIDFVDNPVQAHLEVRGEKEDILIPYVEEFILEVDEGRKTITSKIPAGLLHLGTTRSDVSEHSQKRFE